MEEELEEEPAPYRQSPWESPGLRRTIPIPPMSTPDSRRESAGRRPPHQQPTHLTGPDQLPASAGTKDLPLTEDEVRGKSALTQREASGTHQETPR